MYIEAVQAAALLIAILLLAYELKGITEDDRCRRSGESSRVSEKHG